METYEILKECWIEGRLYKKSQLLKLNQAEAREWLDRKCIKLQVKAKKQASK